MRLILVFFLTKCFLNFNIPFTFSEINAIEKVLSVELSLGNPIKNFTLELDNKVANSWVISSTGEKTENDPYYNYKESTTSSTDQISAKFQNYDINLKGITTYDVLTLRNQGIALESFGFFQVHKTYLGEFFNKKNVVGKLGIGFKGFYKSNFNFVRGLLAVDLISKRQYSMEILNETNGNIVLGEEKRSMYYCPITSYDKIPSKFKEGWLCTLTHMKISEDKTKTSLAEMTEVVSKVLFDYSSSTISIPYKYYSYFSSNIFNENWSKNCKIKKLKTQDSEDYYYICSEEGVDSMKNKSITFIIEGFGYNLNFDNLFIDHNETHSKFLLSFSKLYQSNSEVNEDVWVFGIPFLRHFFTNFNHEESQIFFTLASEMSVSDYSLEWNGWYRKYSRKVELEKIEKKDIPHVNIRIIVVFLSVSLIVVFLIIHYFRKKDLTVEQAGLIKNENK